MKTLLLLLIALFAGRVQAQLPGEVLLIVNSGSPGALTVSNHYAELRGIPAERILVLSPPESFFRNAEGGPQWRARADAVREHLLDPLREKLEALDDPVPTALIFSPDWPTRIALSDGTPVSLTAFAGTLGEMPDTEQIKNGMARSPWFVAPEERAQGRLLPRYPAPQLRRAGLYPAMMLGAHHPPLDTDAIIRSLQRAAGADHTAPAGTVAIVTNTDVRTRARLPQMEPAAERLRRRNIPVTLTGDRASLPGELIGAMEGTASVPMRAYRGKFVPGAFAEHLTSFAGTFHIDSQTKMTEWIAAGAAGTVGTVDEPMSIWTKFPLVEIFDRYTLGNTLLESLMQSIGSPYQSLPLGDPLCRPWGKAFPNLRLESEWEENRLTLRLPGQRADAGTTFQLFIDGSRVPGNGPEWTWTADPETAGSRIDVLLHARKVWAPPETGTLREQITTPFAQEITLAPTRRQPRDALRLTVESRQPLLQLEIYQGHRRVHSESAEGTRHDIRIPLDITGEGPARYQVRAITAGGTLLRSAYEKIDR